MSRRIIDLKKNEYDYLVELGHALPDWEWIVYKKGLEEKAEEERKVVRRNCVRHYDVLPKRTDANDYCPEHVRETNKQNHSRNTKRQKNRIRIDYSR